MNAKQQKQLEDNTKNIEDIKQTLTVMKDNHLHHLEKDVASLDKRLEKIDARIWWVLGLLVAGTVLGMVGDKF